MLGRRWRVLPLLRAGDWRAKLIALAQALVAIGALVGLLTVVTRHPLLLLGFTVVQALIVGGVVCFVVVAIFAQRTLVLERLGPGELVFREGDPSQHVYVIKSGTVEVFHQPQSVYPPEIIKRLGPGDHFGEMALLRGVPRNASVRAVTALEVYRISPDNFAVLCATLPGLRDHVARTMEARLQKIEVGNAARPATDLEKAARQ